MILSSLKKSLIKRKLHRLWWFSCLQFQVWLLWHALSSLLSCGNERWPREKVCSSTPSHYGWLNWSNFMGMNLSRIYCTVMNYDQHKHYFLNSEKRKLSEQRNRALRPLDTERQINDLIDSSEFKGDGEKGIDLPFFDLESILAATDYFSDENKLGQGGYGPVYKVPSVLHFCFHFFPSQQCIGLTTMSMCVGTLMSGKVSRRSRHRNKETFKRFWPRLAGIQEWGYFNSKTSTSKPRSTSGILHGKRREDFTLWIHA